MLFLVCQKLLYPFLKYLIVAIIPLYPQLLKQIPSAFLKLPFPVQRFLTVYPKPQMHPVRLNLMGVYFDCTMLTVIMTQFVIKILPSRIQAGSYGFHQLPAVS